MEIRKVTIDKLKEAPYNPRVIDEKELEKLKRSIRTFGYVEPIVWNKRTGHVVGGNQRLKVLRAMGVKEVEVVVVDLDLEQEKALNLALNRISGDWDFEKLRDIFKELDEGYWNLTGFDDKEIESFLGILEDVEEPPEDLGATEETEVVYKVYIPVEEATVFERLLKQRRWRFKKG